MEETTPLVCLPQGEREAEQRPVPCEKLPGFLRHQQSQDIFIKLLKYFPGSQESTLGEQNGNNTNNLNRKKML